MTLKVNTFVSDGSVLLAFDMPQPDSTFAGFAIQCTPKGAEPYYLLNRLSFTNGVSKGTTADKRVWTTSDKAPFQKYYWLHFPAEAGYTMPFDMFAYDLDGPEFIQGMVQLGKEKRLRAFLDDAPLHTKAGAMEILAKKAILAAAGKSNVVTGHFNRFAHCKVMIQKKNGKAIKVLTGSANFSILGLYVQANNVILINDPKTAADYEQAFDLAFTQQQKTGSSTKTATAFKASPIAQKYIHR